MVRNRLTRRAMLGSMGGVLAGGTFGRLAAAGRSVGSEAANEGETGDGETTDEAEGAESPYADVYRETIDSVVLVQVSAEEGEGGGIGSGFVFDDEHLLTNQHVVGEADEVSLQFHDEQWRSATVVGTDVHADLAVLRIDDRPEIAQPLPISTREPVIGREVLALGNPLGLDASISRGIVSGVDRVLPSPTGFSIPGAIQTDAAVNPGNSGGPLVDLDGEVVGVVFAGAGQNIGFAIPAALVRRVAPALVEDGTYEHPYMGAGVVPVSPPVAEANDLERARGALVTQIVSGSPADDVLRAADDWETVDGDVVPVGGDVIVEIEGVEVPNQEGLLAYLVLETSPGQTIELGIIREGERRTVELTLGARPTAEYQLRP